MNLPPHLMPWALHGLPPKILKLNLNRMKVLLVEPDMSLESCQIWVALLPFQRQNFQSERPYLLMYQLPHRCYTAATFQQYLYS